ncbi:MAG: peptidylprolyl isomerase [Phycisphaerales bacterium]|nr:peptidylprolyl isomerase [Phycisphaerales bacterium]
MRKLWSTTRQTTSPFAVETLEPRIALDGTPDSAANPVVEIQTNYGNIYIELFPDVAPITVENFLGYANRNDWDNTFFHRHVSGFVLQGGGWSFDEDRQDVDHVTQRDPIVNEFDLSNLQWTVAMAKIPAEDSNGDPIPGGGPDSATSEWFINLADNSDNLDDQNGGFTVFGEVVGGRDVVEAITDLRIINIGGNFTSVPMGDDFDVNGDTVLNSDLVVIEDIVLVYDPDTSLLGDTSTVPGGTATGSNLTTVTITSQFDRAIAFQQNGLSGGWTVADLNLKAEQSGNATNPVTWVDSKDGKTYAAAISADGLMLYKNTTGNTWTVRNLNDEISGADLITSSLTTFSIAAGRVYLVGLAANGDMILFRQTDGQSNGGYTWTARNLSETDLLVNNLDTTPAFASPLSSYVTSWGGLNIVGLDAGGAIQAVWWAPGRDAWAVTNLSATTGAPPMVGVIAPYLTSWNAINLTGTDADGNVLVTWWVPTFGATWVQTNLSTRQEGPTFAIGSVATYVTPWGGTNILGRNDDGDLVAYWWSPTLGAGNWQVTNLSQFIAGAESTSGPTIGFSSPSGVVNIFGTAADGDLIRYWWKSTDGWQWENVSSTAVLA